MPIEAAYHDKIRVRPDAAFGYSWSKETLDWQVRAVWMIVIWGIPRFRLSVFRRKSSCPANTTRHHQNFDSKSKRCWMIHSKGLWIDLAEIDDFPCDSAS